MASVALVGSTERGVEYGMRWLSKQLMGGNAGACSGGVLKYMRHAGYMAPRVHRRNVGLTRGLSVTQKRTGDCSTIWLVTFTLTAGESPEYSEPEFLLGDLGAPLATGPSVLSNGALPITYSRCPSYNYSPIYDPQNPALVAAPTPPNFYPSGWVPQDGTVMDRFWAKIKAPEPNTLPYVPIVTLRATDEAARMVRVSIYDAAAPIDSQCEALWTSTVSYLPPEQDLLIDGEERAAYVLMGNGGKRRADSLVFGPEAEARTSSARSVVDLNERRGHEINAAIRFIDEQIKTEGTKRVLHMSDAALNDAKQALVDLEAKHSQLGYRDWCGVQVL